jgi:hypothetical protein
MSAPVPPNITIIALHGLILLIPFIQEMVRVDLRLQLVGR